ncbi:hypothetical protein R3I93_020146 [Phoxinus phoxinus]
MTKSCRG